MIAEMNRTNHLQHDEGLIIGSADVVALYPSLDIDFTIDKVCEVFFESNVKIDGVDYEEVGLYLALNIKPEMLKKIGIAEVCPTRKSNKGRPPTITGSGTEVQKDKRFKPWKPPTQQPSEHTKRVMLTEALRVVLMMIMKNHVYTFNKEIRKANEGWSDWS